MVFGDRLKRLRKERSMSQRELAMFLKVSEACIKDWEDGVVMPDTNNLSKLMVLLGTD